MPTIFEPAKQDPGFDLQQQQYLARLRNTDQLVTLVGDSSGLEGDFGSLEDIVSALVAQLPVHTTAAASGTSVDFTGIPSWARRITLMLDQQSTNGTSAYIIQLGVGGVPEATGYVGSVTTATGGAVNNWSTGATIVNGPAATDAWSGAVTLTLLDSSTNTWSITSYLGQTDNTGTREAGGSKALAGTLDMIRFTTSGGVNTFDARTIGLRYER